jgi:hypothetical protein
MEMASYQQLFAELDAHNSIYVDGDRERIPYEADAYINMLSHYAVDSEYSIVLAYQ